MGRWMIDVPQSLHGDSVVGEYADIYHNRGFAYQPLGKQELAGRDFQKAKELEYES